MNKVRKFKADAIITHLPECPIMVLTADCVPIVIYDPVKHVTGVVHAGRLGTQKQMLSTTISALSDEYGSRPKDLIVGMGPAIRGCCYEVDKDCVLPFIKMYSDKSEIVKVTNKKKFFLDLPEANRREGCEAGVLSSNIYADGPCTFCENQRWYSYRKEGGTGRLITVTMLRSRN
jgi:YfiH family protein